MYFIKCLLSTVKSSPFAAFWKCCGKPLLCTCTMTVYTVAHKQQTSLRGDCGIDCWYAGFLLSGDKYFFQKRLKAVKQTAEWEISIQRTNLHYKGDTLV